MESLKPLSPEWFKAKANEDKYKNVDAEATEIYEDFQNEYSIEKIKSLSGEDILNKIFYLKNKNSLFYQLEYGAKLKIFGGISGTRADIQYGLYFSEKEKVWCSESGNISESEAISLATEIRDKLVLGAEIIKNYGKIKDYNDYVNIFKEFENNKLQDKDIKKFWILKYYHMIFPTLFPPFYSDYWHMHILFNLKLSIEPKERFLRMGKIACFAKDCNVSNITFAQIIGDYIGVPKKFFRIGTGDNNFDDWKNKGYIAIGWNELGDLSTFFVENKEKIIKQKISLNLKEIYTKDKATITKKTNEIYDFYTTKQNISYIVAMRGKKILGFGILNGDYYFNEKNKVGGQYAHCRKVKWLMFPNNFQIGEGKLTTFCELKNTEYIRQLYNLMGSKEMEKTQTTKQPLNQILYGPPGTGKTYNTVIKAMEIIAPNKIEYDENNNVANYENLKEEFDELKKSGQIEFITFHQSYSYEEFIEGIKPNIEEWETEAKNISYKGKNGILKDISNLSFKDLYEKKANISFEEILNRCKEKYPDGSDINTLKDIHYNEKELVYHFGVQTQDRKIDLDKIKELFEKDKEYNSALEFNNDYKGNSSYSLACYHYKFYKELVSIKNELEKQKLNENIKEYKLKENPNKYILIIDEINRGNISKIFGEMITLIEEDKRIGNEHELKLTLPYSKEPFGIPNNLYIIGTMNTSDRSIASVDIALRRRFKFIEMMPKSELVTNISIENTTFQEIFKALNEKITILLDRDHQIGHSYFMQNKIKSIDDLKNVWFSEILPLLNEYFYNDWDKLQALLGKASKNNDSFITIKETKLPFYQYDIEDKVYDFVDKKNISDNKFELALLKIIDEPKNKQEESSTNK